MEVTHADEQAMQRIADWKSRGAVLPGPEVHVPFMPYGRTSAEDARRSGQAGVDFREAAVLIGVEPHGRVVLIERAPGGGVHGGQMALPGGSREPGESLEDCALREWREELGLEPFHQPTSDIVALTEVHVVPSRFIVRPHLATVTLGETLDFDPVEVGAIHRIRLVDLMGDSVLQSERVRVGGRKGLTMVVPGFFLPGVPFIWGATAMMLSELRSILLMQED